MRRPRLDTSIVNAAIALVALCLGTGCGDDDAAAASHGDGGTKRNAGHANDAAIDANAGDGGSQKPSSMIGNACTTDADCSGGTCAHTLGARMPALAPGGYCTVSCKAPADCDPSSACVGARFGFSGHCSIGCDDTSTCRGGYRCVPIAISNLVADAGTANAVTKTCEPTPDTDKLADGIVGSACSGDANCGGGQCLLSENITSTTYPGGYCTGRCVDDSDCGARGLCTPGFLGSIGSCALRCDNDADCGRDGYRCRVIDGVGRCAPGPKPLPDHVVGNACANDGDCGGGAMTCADPLGSLDAPGGYCSQACAIDDDCGAGGTCISGIGIVTLSTGICLKSCAPPGGCRDGYVCRSLSGAASSDNRGVCMPEPASDDAGSP